MALVFSKGLKTNNITALVYGDVGAGKTHFLGNALRESKFQKGLIIDTDMGLSTIGNLDESEVYHVKIDSAKDLKEVALGLLANKPPYNEVKTLLLDSATKLMEMELTTIAERQSRAGQRNADTDQQLQDYKEMTARIGRLIHNFKSTGRNFLITAGVMDDLIKPDDPVQFRLRRPLISAKLRKMFGHASDHVWYIYRSGPEVRLVYRPITTAWGGTIEAKTRNPRFEAILDKMSIKKDTGETTGMLLLGKTGESLEGYPTFSQLFDLYMQCMNEESND